MAILSLPYMDTSWKGVRERILPSICFQAQATPIHDPRGSILGNGKGPPTPPFYDTLGRYHSVPSKGTPAWGIPCPLSIYPSWYHIGGIGGPLTLRVTMIPRGGEWAPLDLAYRRLPLKGSGDPFQFPYTVCQVECYEPYIQEKASYGPYQYIPCP